MLQPLLLLLLLVAVPGDECPSLGMNGMEAGAKLHRLARNALGIDQIQRGFDINSKMAVSIPNGELKVDQLAECLARIFRQFYGLVTELRDTVEEAVSKPETNHSIQQCCDLSNDSLREEEGFDRLVSSEICYKTSDDVQRERLLPVWDIQDTMKRAEGQIDSSFLKWQYVGTLDGLFLSYPAEKNCAAYDPRIRPWYVEAATPIPKRMVLVVDTTAGHNSNLTSQAVNVILDAVNPNDQIGIVRFGSEAYMTHGSSTPACFGYKLASATPHNIKMLQKFIKNAPVLSETNDGYKEALLEAFKLIQFSSTSSKKNHMSMILFMTHKNLTKTENLRKVIKEAREHFNSSVHILTFSMGTDINTETKHALQTLATSNKMTEIHSPKDLHSTMGIDERITLTSPIITTPYLDSGGQGMVVSICLPAYGPDHQLYGVTCADGQLQNILFNITNVEDPRGSYTFIIDDEGHTFVHPKLPAIGHYSEKPPLVDISTLEQEPDAKSIIQAMKEGKHGRASFNTVHFSSGHPRQLTLNYYWRKIPETIYTICLVLPQDHLEVLMTEVKVKTNYLHPAFVQDEGKHLCLHQEQEVTFESSSVVLNHKAFIRKPPPRKDYYHEVYSDYFNDPGSGRLPKLNLKPATKAWVWLSGLVDNVWTTKSNLYVYWRYLITITGVYRIFPGSTFENVKFTQSWYKKAITNTHQLILKSSHPPYTRGGVITLSTSIFISRPNITRPRPDIPIAVVAGDFDKDYIFQAVIQNIPNCRSLNYRCLFVDDEGYVLTHSKRSGKTDRQEEQNIWASHLTKLEPVVSSILIERGLLTKHRCINHARLRTEFVWMIQVQEGLMSFCNQTAIFEIHVLYRTNAYLIIVSKETQSKKPNCQCQEAADLPPCSSIKEPCQCPCYDQINFDYCKNKFRESFATILPECPTSDLDVHHDLPQPPVARNLPSCHPFTCTDIDDYIDCGHHTQCEWCTTSDVPGCNIRSQCSPTTSTANDNFLFLLFLLLPISIIILIFGICKTYPEHVCIKKSRECFPGFKSKFLRKTKQPLPTINTSCQATNSKDGCNADREPTQGRNSSPQTQTEQVVISPQGLQHEVVEIRTFSESVNLGSGLTLPPIPGPASSTQHQPSQSVGNHASDDHRACHQPPPIENNSTLNSGQSETRPKSLYQPTALSKVC